LLLIAATFAARGFPFWPSCPAVGLPGRLDSRSRPLRLDLFALFAVVTSSVSASTTRHSSFTVASECQAPSKAIAELAPIIHSGRCDHAFGYGTLMFSSCPPLR
jgi:hypothetical protein